MSSPILDLNEYGSLNVLYTIISMIVMKMKSILHNTCCQLLCVVSSNRNLYPFSFCSILCFWTSLNKMYLQNPTLGACSRGPAPPHTGTWPTLWFESVKLFYCKRPSSQTVTATENITYEVTFFQSPLNISLFEYNLGELIQHVVLKWKLEYRLTWEWNP